MRERIRDGDAVAARVGGCLLFGFAAKVIYETLSGAALFADTGGELTTVPIAHLVGGLSGGLCAIDIEWKRIHHPFSRVKTFLGETK
jgi:hypothetical protein